MTRNSERRRRPVQPMRVVALVAVSILAIIELVPIYYLLVTTMKTPDEAARAPLALPEHPSLEPYVNAFWEMNYPQAFLNTAIITVCAVVGVIVFASMAAYVLYRKSGSRIATSVFLLLMSGMLFPYQMSIMGLYDLIRDMGLMNTRASVILIDIAVSTPFAMFLFYSFMSTIPKDVEEAAMLDGAGTFRRFTTIVFPLLKPVVLTVAILNTLSIWNDFMGPLYFLQDRDKNVILQEVYRNVGQFTTDWTQLFPMMVLGVLPLVVFFLLMQRKIIGGVVAGALKG